MPEYYEIKIKGHLDQSWSERFAGLKLTHLEGDGTMLSGLLPDQAALHGLLEHIRDLNLTLISVTSRSPSTQDSDTERSKDMKTNSNPSSEKTFACETCSMRKKAEANPKTLMARLWRWHTGWCPGWKAYQAHLAEQGKKGDAP